MRNPLPGGRPLVAAASLVALLPLCAPAQARRPEPPALGKPRLTIGVKINVTSRDVSLRNAITSYLSREIRRIDDAEIVEKEEDWLVSVVALARGREGAYAMSVVFSWPHSSKFQVYSEQYLLAGTDDDDLRTQCRDVVNALDAECLKQDRDNFAEYLKKPPPANPRRIQ